MALSIRNLTTHALELISAERFESEKVSVGNVLKTFSGTITGFLNATATTFHEVHPKGTAHTSHALAEALPVPPLATVASDIPVPSSSDHARSEILRLAFRVSSSSSDSDGTGDGDDGDADDGAHWQTYETDVPSPHRRSAPMRRVGAGAGAADDETLELAALYVPAQSLVAVLPAGNPASWMASLDDAWPLSVLSIPGTHNSPTCHTALPSVRCQHAGVPEQLANGVRFLDVRVSVSPGSSRLALVHSAFPIALTGGRWFADMLDDVYAFLDAHPSETVLMSIKREGTGKGTDHQLGRCLKHDYIDSKGRRDRWWTEPRMPLLGRARGRIVVVRRFALDPDMQRSCWDGRGWGLDASQWPDNCEDGVVGAQGLLRVQDFYEVTESQNIDKKIGFSRSQLERAAGQVFRIPGLAGAADGHHADGEDSANDIPPFFVNFLSASNFFNAACWPERIAAKVNPAILEYLCANHGRPGKGPADLAVGLAGTGVVVTDWVGANDDWDLIRCIIGMNARLQRPKEKK
ncbi:1-phosphatidylinositol phosphodiesterase [Escovopsis weberi]|uniref:1-phosphatidylinositol phosphodiesterase n=1 Tax=Escovopsis weberi TaxID=150374 RepID=A0A0M9VTE4_ESCWE|nr:1-phosphatidylinositol phosphodiesterase [Escovopsis weberi]